MSLSIRSMTPADAQMCGTVAFEAHRSVAAAHNFPSEQPSPEFAIGMMKAKLEDPASYGLVAERDGSIVGSIFLNSFLPEIAVIGPLTVHPNAQGGAGRELLEAALAEARRRRVEGVRLVQSPYHIRSLVLYTKLGFEARESLLLVQGRLPHDDSVGLCVRAATLADVAACNQVSTLVHGIRREMELRRAIERHVASVVERDGRIVGYATGIGLLGHAVAEATDHLKALIAAAPAILGPGFFVPIRNADLLRWLLMQGMQAGWPATLMSMGRYQEPAGGFLPAISM